MAGHCCPSGCVGRASWQFVTACHHDGASLTFLPGGLRTLGVREMSGADLDGTTKRAWARRNCRVAFLARKTESLASPFLCPEFSRAVDRFCSNAVSPCSPTDRTSSVSSLSSGAGSASSVPIGFGINDCQGLIHAPDVEWDPRELFRAWKVSVWQFGHLAEGQRPFERYAAAVAPSPGFALKFARPTGWILAELRGRCPKLLLVVREPVGQVDHPVSYVHGGLTRSGGASHLMRWRSGQYHHFGWADIFDRPWIVEVADYLFSTHSDQFGGQLPVLYAGETPVAAHFGLRSGHVLARWFPACDPGFSRQSPGLIQHMRMAEETAALDIHLINLGKGAERYKQTLKTHELVVAQGMAAGAPLPAAAHRAHQCSWMGRPSDQADADGVAGGAKVAEVAGGQVRRACPVPRPVRPAWPCHDASSSRGWRGNRSPTHGGHGRSPGNRLPTAAGRRSRSARFPASWRARPGEMWPCDSAEPSTRPTRRGTYRLDP
jgi:hypothetical protein